MNIKKIKISKQICIFFGLILLDILLILVDKFLHLLYFSNYFDIISVIYQVQSAIVAFSVLGLSLFSNSLDYKVYGVPFKEIITRKKFLCLNYWEAIIFSIVLLPINMLGIICASMTSVIAFFVFDFVIILYLIINTIDVLVDSEKNETICKEIYKSKINSNELTNIKIDQYLYNLGIDIIESVKTGDCKSSKKIEFIFELYQDSFQKNSQYLYFVQDNLAKIFIEIVNKSDEEEVKWFFEKSYDMFINLNVPNKMNIANYLLPTMLNKFFDTVYSGSYTNLNVLEIKMAIFDTLKNYFVNDKLDVAVDYLLFFAQKTIYYRDKKIYYYLISELYKIGNQRKYSRVLYVLSVYIYYLCWNNNSPEDEVVDQNIGDLKKIITNSHNYNENNIHNYIKFYRDYIFEEFTFIKSKLSLSFWKSFSRKGTSSTDIQYAMYEFFAFIGQKFYPDYSYSRNLSHFEIDDLLQIYVFFDVKNGILDAKLNQEYSEFFSWIGIEENLPSTSAFFSDISDAIFFRLQNKYRDDRSNKKTEFRDNFNKIKESIQLELNQSPFLIEENNNNIVIQISKNVLLDSLYTEKKTININLEKSIRKEIEENVIKINKKCFKDINISLVDKSKQKSISRILQKLKVMGKNRINIDKYLNQLISDKEWVFIKNDNEKIQKFIDFEKNLQKRGELILQNYLIYFDSTKMNIGFTLVDIMFIDQIDNTDIRNILSELPIDGNSVEMNIAGQKYYLERESAFEYIKSAYCKIVVEVKIQKSEEKCGLILKPKLLTNNIIST